MWSMKGGNPELKELNDEYYNSYKENPETMVYSGFRIWKKVSKESYEASADGGGVIYTLADWSSKITFPGKEEDKADAGTGMETDNQMMDGMMSEEEKMMMEEEKQMIMMIIIVVAFALVLIMCVIICFCRMRARNNTKTPIQLNEGGETEMAKVTDI